MTKIDARHPGVCPKCDETFDVGERIEKDHGDVSWRHVVCPEPRAICRPACPECWTELAVNGSCMCVVNG